jgi:NAD(P)-dependent dehydrogenase (short-subunit alcohol dehydrogenase family)
MSHPFNLSGKNILVTGASSGIGRSIAIHCANESANVSFSGRNTEKLNETKNLLKKTGTHQEHQADLRDDSAIAKLADELPELDGLVFNAGVVKLSPLKFIKRNDIDELFNVNLNSSILLLQSLMKQKKIRNGSSICFISSVASQHVTLGNALYSATKGAVNSFTKSAALELAPKQIRVNAILPGFVETSILNHGSLDTEQIKEHGKNYPIGRFGKPEDVALLAIYLLSDASQWMTGSLLTIDGGYSIK